MLLHNLNLLDKIDTVNLGESGSHEDLAHVADFHEYSLNRLWHLRSGHTALRSLRNALRFRSVKGIRLNKTRKICFCETCALCLQKRRPFPRRRRKRAVRVNQRVWFDIAGPSLAGVLGLCYLLLWVDEYSGWCTPRYCRDVPNFIIRSVIRNRFATRVAGKQIRVHWL